ncbi:hypothetical protein GCM10023346_45780 [Arthrobacter gyeryongensis]|uniref:Uncharacterized protein n=1 Tax=Arthrobacter gyeryongensis TaxID=1650592 RepID=A0ABP9SUG3_9MICC
MLKNSDDLTDGAQNDDLPDGAPSRRTIARDYVHCTHPETGLEVVFMPGEALPDFAAAVQEANERAESPLVTDEPKLVKGNRAVKQETGR